MSILYLLIPTSCIAYILISRIYYKSEISALEYDNLTRIAALMARNVIFMSELAKAKSGGKVIRSEYKRILRVYDESGVVPARKKLYNIHVESPYSVDIDQYQERVDEC
jgi:hypothetical protein